MHSHNDFAQKRPLQTALENGYHSIEVDVIDRWGEIRVTHLGFITDGSLKEMYLDRLQKLVNEKGSVHGDGKRFYLWIELRPFFTSESIVSMLQELLPRYPMFARFSEDGKEISPGPVEAILINSSSLVSKFFEGSSPKPACRGVSGLPYAGEKPGRFVRWSYLRWGGSFLWNGEGPMPKSEVKRIQTIQARARSAGVRTRFWGVPETEGFWKQAATLPFDLVGTDHLAQTKTIVSAPFSNTETLAGTRPPALPERPPTENQPVSAADAGVARSVAGASAPTSSPISAPSSP